jgi:hypothetical protein
MQRCLLMLLSLASCCGTQGEPDCPPARYTVNCKAAAYESTTRAAISTSTRLVPELKLVSVRFSLCARFSPSLETPLMNRFFCSLLGAAILLGPGGVAAAAAAAQSDSPELPDAKSRQTDGFDPSEPDARRISTI